MLTGGVSTNGGGGGFGLGGLGSLLNGLVSLTGGGGTLSGGVSSDGSVAPQYYSGGLFGIGAKTIPGLTAAPKNASYPGQVQGYALNPPNIPSAAPMQLSPMGTPNIILPGYASYGGGGGGGYNGGTAVPTVASLPGVAGGAAPGGGPIAVAPQYGGQQQLQQGGEGGAPQGSPQQPLQGYVSNQPEQAQQPAWMGQIGQLAQGAADFAGQLFGGQPAMAANRANTPSGLVPPPPPDTPSMLANGNVYAQPYQPQQAYPQVPSAQNFQNQVAQKMEQARQLGTTIGSQTFGTPTLFSSLADLRADVARGAKQVAAGVDVYAKQLRAAYAKAINDRFNTPRSDLRDTDAQGNPVGPPLTVLQWRNQLESQLKQLDAENDRIAAQTLTPEMVAQARAVVNHAENNYARGAAALAQPVPGRRGIYGLFNGATSGNPLAAAEAQNHLDPVLRQQQAIDLAQRSLDSRRAHALAVNATLRQDRVAQIGAINKELSELTGRSSEGEKMIFEVRKQAVDAFYEQAKLGLDGFIAAGNREAEAFKFQLASDQNAARQWDLDQSLMLEQKKFTADQEAKTRLLEAQVAQQGGQGELGAMNANTQRIAQLRQILKDDATAGILSDADKSVINKEIMNLINLKPGTTSVVRQQPTVEAVRKTAGGM